MLKIKTPEIRHQRHYDLFIVNFEYISYLFLAFLIVDFKYGFVCWGASVLKCVSLCV